MVKKEREREKRLMDTVQPNVPYSIGSPAWVTYLLPRYLPAKNDAITCLDAFIGEYRFIRLSTLNIAFLVFSLVYSISVISSYSELPCSPFALVRYEIGYRQLGALLAFTISILTCSWKNWIIKTNGFVRVIPIKWMKFFYSGFSIGVHRSEVIQN